MLRFHIDLGNVVIAKSSNKDRIKSNIEIFDFKLDEDDLKELKSFGYTERVFPFLDDIKHPEYPFNEE